MESTNISLVNLVSQINILFTSLLWSSVTQFWLKIFKLNDYENHQFDSIIKIFHIHKIYKFDVTKRFRIGMVPLFTQNALTCVSLKLLGENNQVISKIWTRDLYFDKLHMRMHADDSASPTLGHSYTFRYFYFKYTIKNDLCE